MEPGFSLGEIWRRIARNAALILGGRAVFGLLNLASSVLAVRAVGLEGFAAVVLLQAWVRLIAGTVRFRTWPAVTSFGATALGEGRTEDFRRLFGFGLRLDAVGLVAGVAVGAFGATLAADIFDWPEQTCAAAMWFALTIPFITPTSPTGVLRLFDRFAVLAQQHAINAVVRFAGVAAIWWLSGGVEAMIWVWAAGFVASGAWMLAVAFAEARRRGVLPKLRGRWSTLSAGFPRIWRMVLVLNATAILDTLLAQGPVLAVNAMLGPTAAGLYGVVRQMTEALTRMNYLTGAIVLPEFAWLEARKDRGLIGRMLWRILIGGGALLAALAAVFFFAAGPLLGLLYGDEARAGAPLLLAAGVAAGIMALSFAVEPVMIAIRRDKALLNSYLVSMVVFLPAFPLLVESFGLVGAGLALLLQQAVLLTVRVVVLRRALVDRPG